MCSVGNMEIKLMKEIYAIKDETALIFNMPAFVGSVVEVVRSVLVLLKSKENLISQFPSEYKVYFLGRYDEGTGIFTLPVSGKPEMAFTVESLLRKDVKNG